MAIDFSRAFRGIATGALGAANQAIEQKDRMYAEIAVSAGKNYLENILPQSIEAEKRRKENYNRIFSLTGDRNFTELMDRDGFTTLNNGVTQATELYKNVDKEKLKAATFETSYEDRYNQRQKSQREKYDPILKQLGFGIGGIGPNTVKAEIEEDFVTGKDTQPAKQPTGTADMTQQTAMKDTDTAPASTTISDFLVSKPVTFQLAETEFARVAQNYGFGNAIKFLPGGGIDFTFPGEDRTKYNALRAETNEVLREFLDKDQKVNTGQAVEEAAKRINFRVHGTYSDAFGQGYRKKDSKQGDIVGPGKPEYKAEAFTDDFNKLYPTDIDKQNYFEEKMESLGTTSQQRYFALSAPENIPFVVTNDDGSKTAKTTLRKYLLGLVPSTF
tara:strand:- start:5740 stop:6900 length:1161 start_codon:yes stop_codon:yes gene_type:complete